jgi:protein-tyrosine phosphatase
MTAHTARALSELRVETNGHASHRISERRLAQADLVLTATRAQMSSLLELQDEMRERTFTIREFARLAAALDPLPARPAGLVAAVADARASVRSLDVPQDDVDDPADGSFRDHERSIKLIDLATRDLSLALAACLRSPMSGVA